MVVNKSPLWVTVAVTVVVAVAVLASDSDCVAAPDARLQGSEWAEVLNKNGFGFIKALLLNVESQI